MSEASFPASVRMSSLRPLEMCDVNGFRCEVLRQARRTTYLRVLDSRLPGRAVVQLDKKLPSGEPRMVERAE